MVSENVESQDRVFFGLIEQQVNSGGVVDRI